MPGAQLPAGVRFAGRALGIGLMVGHKVTLTYQWFVGNEM
jgi:hypothetical protein